MDEKSEKQNPYEKKLPLLEIQKHVITIKYNELFLSNTVNTAPLVAILSADLLCPQNSLLDFNLMQLLDSLLQLGKKAASDLLKTSVFGPLENTECLDILLLVTTLSLILFLGITYIKKSFWQFIFRNLEVTAGRNRLLANIQTSV